MKCRKEFWMNAVQDPVVASSTSLLLQRYEKASDVWFICTKFLSWLLDVFSISLCNTLSLIRYKLQQRRAHKIRIMVSYNMLKTHFVETSLIPVNTLIIIETVKKVLSFIWFFLHILSYFMYIISLFEIFYFSLSRCWRLFPY